jgi:antitoxin component of RelBE/YafQ-DinJ toxin-antitoxin module
MPDRSERKDSFLGLYVTSETKEQVQQAAEQEGVSISEAVRRRLRDSDHAADGAAAT